MILRVIADVCDDNDDNELDIDSGIDPPERHFAQTMTDLSTVISLTASAASATCTQQITCCREFNILSQLQTGAATPSNPPKVDP